MGRLKPDHLHVTFALEIAHRERLVPRCYTLTHADLTGALFLTVAPTFHKRQISGLFARLMRDEVLGEWKEEASGLALHVHVHASGGFAVGRARMRLTILERHLPLGLKALRYGDRNHFEENPELDQAPNQVHFHAAQPRYDSVEHWGAPGDFRFAG